MSMRKFQFRLFAQYESQENTVTHLLFEHQVGHEWREYDPANHAAGFLMLLYAILNCQHMYFRVNAAERGLQLRSANAKMEVETNSDWEMQKLHIHIAGDLVAGTPTADDEAYIVERMAHCPVSVNLAVIPDSQTSVQLAQ